MKTSIYILATTMLAFLIFGCTPPVDSNAKAIETFVSTTKDGGYVNGKLVLGANENQVSTNLQRKTYRVQDDNQISYIMLTMSDLPSVLDQSIDVELATNGVEGLTSGTTKMEVKKVSGTKFWLWNKDKQFGVIIDYN